MVDLRSSLFVIGLLLIVLALSMTLPAIADASANGDVWHVFITSAGATLFVGVSLALAFRKSNFQLNLKETFILTTASWLAVTLFASLPLWFSSPQFSMTDAFFEAMSGLTTTGSTVMSDLDQAPRGILLWRAILQWLGGIGIIVMAVAVLPILRVGGMQLFRTESSDHSQKILPRAAPIAGWIALTYFALTLLWATALWFAGMGKFDAICHAMTTMSTGGFSTSDGSIGDFNEAAIDWIIIGGMLVGGMPFILYLRAMRGDFGVLIRDTQIQWFIGFCILSALIMTAWLWYHMEAPPVAAIRYATFNTVSVITGTGFTTAPYDQWGSFAITVLFFLMFVGGCTGSTTGGIKVFRYQVLLSSARVELTHLIRPHAVIAPRYNGEPIPDGIANAVRGFFFVFFAGFAVTALALGLQGYDFITSTSGAATAIANVGPGLGPLIGPTSNFSLLSDSAKWILSAAMLLGRLELFTVLVLFIPSFWRE